MRKEETKKLSKYFFLFFLLFLFIFGWPRIYWFFEWSNISGLFFDFFQSEANKNKNFESPQNFEEFLSDSFLEIPKLNLSLPLFFVEDRKDVYKFLKKGVIIFPGSAMPSRAGPTIILGHSVPLNWPKHNYDWAFSRLEELEKGDEIIIRSSLKKYNYFVKEKFFLDKGEKLPTYEKSKNTLFLVSCWPPGKATKRIVILSLFQELPQ